MNATFARRLASISIGTALIVLAVLVLVPKSPADEGMWTFDNPPLLRLQQRYGFTPTPEWLDHLRLASVRFMDGGSGSFISADGLILTNHHVAMGQLQKLSTAEQDLVAAGFYARTREEELPSPDLEINILQSMENVTERVQTAIEPGLSDTEALQARRAEIARIEKEALDRTGLRPEVVDLYHGGEYWLYLYKRYTDVRLVMAPERQAAYFGGDYDNFTYPRYDLDMAFFRAYENGQPVKPESFLQWNPEGVASGDLVFVSGHPGSTNRLYTVERLEYQRDVAYPMRLDYIDRYLGILRDYAARGPEEERRALGLIFGLENSKKALTGEFRGLQDEDLIAKKRQEQEEFRRQVRENPEWRGKYGEAWAEINKALEASRTRAEELFYRRPVDRLMGLAQSIVMYAQEIQKPDAERLPGYHESELEALRFNLLSPAPIYKDLEQARMEAGLNWGVEALGRDDEYFRVILDGAAPEETAERLISGTRLDDLEMRRKLVEGGWEAVQASDDPLIAVARELAPIIREDARWSRENVESLLSAGEEKIAQARFAVYGKTTYPDATFTLRLAFGEAVGYPMNGTIAPWKTTLYGLYDRSLSFGREGDFALPRRFWDRQKSLDLSTAVNFVSTADIIGGNSGSPVVNRAGELVGVIFDGNIESLVGRFIYDETTNRAVSVHAAYMLEALRKLYDAEPLAAEIMGGRTARQPG